MRWTICVLILASLSCATIERQRFAARCEIDVTIRGGSPEGVYYLYDPSGQLVVRGQYVAGQKSGTWDFYGSDGTQTMKITYERDLRNGPFRMWFSTPPDQGDLKQQGQFQEGEYHGRISGFYPGGVRRNVWEYEGGRLASAQYWSPSGEPFSESDARERAAGDVRADRALFEGIDGVVADSFRFSARRRDTRPTGE